jgi:hypothetical protein
MAKQPRPFRTVTPDTVCVPAATKIAGVDVENAVERPFASMIVDVAPAPAIVRVRNPEAAASQDVDTGRERNARVRNADVGFRHRRAQ